jgi:hypothetical protein
MVYLIRMTDSDYYKVGYTGGNLSERLAALQTAAPRKLIVIATIEDGTPADERQIQIQLAHCHTDGGDEWFELAEGQAQQLTKGWQHDVTVEWYGRYRETSQAGGIHASHVRQVRRGQQDATPGGIKDVFHAGWENAVHPGDQPVVFPVREEHNERIEADRE